MIIYNSSARVIVGRYMIQNSEVREEVRDGKKVNVKTVKPSDPVKDMRHFDFIPGNNEITKEAWEGCTRDNAFDHYIEDEVLRVVVDKDEKNGLLNISQKQAIKIILDTFDEALLELWKKTENRDAVNQAIDKQLESMQLKSKKED